MLWKKCEPWLRSTFIDGSVASTMALAPPICDHSTGMPSHGSELPQRPKPIEQVGPAGVHQVEVEPRDLRRDRRRVARLEALRLHVDDVVDVVDDAVAHDAVGRERAGRRAVDRGRGRAPRPRLDTAIGRTCRKPNCAGPSPSSRERHRELDLDRAAQRVRHSASSDRRRSFSAVLLQHEQRREGERARPADAHAHRQPVGLRVVGGRDVAQRLVLLGVLAGCPAPGTRSRRPGRRRAAAHVDRPEVHLRLPHQLADRRVRAASPAGCAGE